MPLNHPIGELTYAFGFWDYPIGELTNAIKFLIHPIRELINAVDHPIGNSVLL